MKKLVEKSYIMVNSIIIFMNFVLNLPASFLPLCPFGLNPPKKKPPITIPNSNSLTLSDNKVSPSES